MCRKNGKNIKAISFLVALRTMRGEKKRSVFLLICFVKWQRPFDIKFLQWTYSRAAMPRKVGRIHKAECSKHSNTFTTWQPSRKPFPCGFTARPNINPHQRPHPPPTKLPQSQSSDITDTSITE